MEVVCTGKPNMAKYSYSIGGTTRKTWKDNGRNVMIKTIGRMTPFERILGITSVTLCSLWSYKFSFIFSLFYWLLFKLNWKQRTCMTAWQTIWLTLSDMQMLNPNWYFLSYFVCIAEICIICCFFFFLFFRDVCGEVLRTKAIVYCLLIF